MSQNVMLLLVFLKYLSYKKSFIEHAFSYRELNEDFLVFLPVFQNIAHISFTENFLCSSNFYIKELTLNNGYVMQSRSELKNVISRLNIFYI